MLKPFNRYSLNVNASVTTGLAAQVLCYQDGTFVGRIDFYANQSLSPSYFWNITPMVIVLMMPIERLPVVLELLREEGPFGLELNGTIGTGITSSGYGGVLRTVEREPVGEGELALAH